MPLPNAPPSIVEESGRPRFGAYAGSVRDTSLSSVGAEFRDGPALAREKKWLFAFVGSPDLCLSAAVVQLGYLASAFVCGLDRRTGALPFNRSFIVPPMLAAVGDDPGAARASLRRVRSRLSIDAAAGRLEARLSGGVALDLALQVGAAPPPLTAICPLARGAGVAMTQKTSCVPARGEVTVGSRTWRLSDAWATLDYSHGLLARETEWRWASAAGRLRDGRRVGLNLVEGHNDGEISENALWLDGELVPVRGARFEFDRADPLAPWKLTSADGRVDLRFEAEGLRAEDVDLKVIVSRYAAPFGSFSGTLVGPGGERWEVDGLPGVCEDHRARW